MFGSFESTIIKDRITGITAWFGQVLSTPGLKDCYDLCKFLGVPSSEASPCAIVHGSADRVVSIEYAESCAKVLALEYIATRSLVLFDLFYGQHRVCRRALAQNWSWWKIWVRIGS